MVIHIWGSSTGELEAEVLGVQGQPQLHREFKASQCYLRPCPLKQEGGPRIFQLSSSMDFHVAR